MLHVEFLVPSQLPAKVVDCTYERSPHAEFRENRKDDSLLRILVVLPGLKKAKQNKTKE